METKKQYEAPGIKVIFMLKKLDSNNFEWDSVTKRLGTLPTETSGPMLSKGKVTFKKGYSMDDFVQEFPATTLLTDSGPPYCMINHACWKISFPINNCWTIEDAISPLKLSFLGKENEIQKVCADNNLMVQLSLRIFTDSNNLPEMSLSKETLVFFAAIGATIDFDFYQD